MQNRKVGAALAVLVATGLTACGGAGGSGSSTQVAARVNTDEITVHQINTALSQARNPGGSDPAKAGAQILERLIDQQLLVQQAEAAQLDRDPRVLQVIDASRREILARAYLEQKAGSASPPSSEEIDAYYRENPALFAERRIYNLQELSIRIDPARHDEVKGRVESAKSLKEIVDWLKAQDIPFTAGASAKPAEQLPMELLPRFAAMTDGQIALVRQPQGITVVHLAGSGAQPIDRATAQPLIEKFLVNQRRAELARGEIKRLRDQAEIAYVGAFARSEAQAEADAQAPASAAAPAPDAAAGAMERGVAGLK
ncbi:MAG: peptidyl-prolyl cis-trans isomerase, EpsD family [Zoogloeaceae bacterium]|nr:peptidyl-prolyl cis-trans isomerase, EpsD family [Zoogloeaceae bacterium]